jgi:hypothetical protein
LAKLLKEPNVTITWELDDGGSSNNLSALVATTVAITSRPTVTAGATATFVRGGSAVTLDPSLTVADAGATTLIGATVSVNSGFLAGDTLNFSNQNGITGSYNSATGVLTLSGTASLANYQAALDSITYSFTPASGDATAGATDLHRGIAWTANDGLGSSSPVTSDLDVQLFRSPTLVLDDFGASPGAGGWNNATTYPLTLGDVTGNHLADIVGFGSGGVYVSLATGSGGFANPSLALGYFGASSGAGGWSSNDTYPRELADVNGDGRADIVGFGSAGTYVAFATGGGQFTTPSLAIANFGASSAAGGWSSQDSYPRELGDVNGDGRADIVGFGYNGVYVSLAQSNGNFSNPYLALGDFGASPSAGGWSSQNSDPRFLADLTGNGRDNIVGFGAAGVYVSMNLGNGQFSAPQLALADFGSDAAAGGWTSQGAFPRFLADVNGDGKADIVGFGPAGVYVSINRGNGQFASPQLAIPDYGSSASAGGWSSESLYPRLLADITGDGLADIVGFGSAGVYTSPNVALLAQAMAAFASPGAPAGTLFNAAEPNQNQTASLAPPHAAASG